MLADCIGYWCFDMGDQLATTAGEIHSASQKVTGSTPFCRIRICDWEIAAFEQGGNFIGIDLIVFCFAAVDGFHV